MGAIFIEDALLGSIGIDDDIPDLAAVLQASLSALTLVL